MLNDHLTPAAATTCAAEVDTHTRRIASAAALVVPPLARGNCSRCGIRIGFLSVMLCDHCLTDRLAELGAPAA